MNLYLSEQDAASEILGELSGRPDLVIGNYSDGNLVASLISHHLGVTQVFFTNPSGIWNDLFENFQLLRLALL